MAHVYSTLAHILDMLEREPAEEKEGDRSEGEKEVLEEGTEGNSTTLSAPLR